MCLGMVDTGNVIRDLFLKQKSRPKRQLSFTRPNNHPINVEEWNIKTITSGQTVVLPVHLHELNKCL